MVSVDVKHHVYLLTKQKKKSMRHTKENKAPENDSQRVREGKEKRDETRQYKVDT